MLAKILATSNNTSDMSVEHVGTGYQTESYYVVDSEDDKPEQLASVSVSEDPVTDYFKNISKTPLLSAEQEVDLAKRIEAGLMAGRLLMLRQKASNKETLSDAEQELVSRWRGKVAADHLEWLEQDGAEAKNHMLEANLRLVVSIARRFQRRGLPLLDLIQEGYEGLNKAVEKFDYTKGYKFSTYATWWIRQSLQRGIAKRGRIIRLPVHIVERANKLYTIERQEEAKTGHTPSIEELAEAMELTSDKVIEVKKLSRPIKSLDTPVGDGGSTVFNNADATLIDLLDDKASDVNVEDAVGNLMLREALEAALETLTFREQQVIIMRYGLDDGKPKKLQEISTALGFSHEGTRQIEARALKRLRFPSRSDALRDFLD